MLGLGDQRQVAKAHALAVARPVDDQAADAARREVGHAVAVLQFLGDVEAVEEHHAGRGLAAGRGRIGMHEQRGQARRPVRHLDRLDARMPDVGGRILEDFHRLGVDVEAALRAWMDEALAGLVVAAGAHEARRRGLFVALALFVAPARLDLVAHAGPFLEPGIVVADMIFERAADAVHLVDLDAGPWRGGEADQQAHRPAVVGREVEECGVVFAADHG